jgi:nucleoside-diphosphate-sugar epimerase
VRVVVTGASGNVGTSVLEALGADPAVSEIVGLARRVPQRSFAKTTWSSADVRHADLTSLFAGADVVIHLAWLIQPSRDERQTRSVNVVGSARVFDAVAAAGVPALLYASSVGAYSPGPVDRAVDKSWPDERRHELVLLAPQGRRRAPARRLRAAQPGRTDCAAATGADLQGDRRERRRHRSIRRPAACCAGASCAAASARAIAENRTGAPKARSAAWDARGAPLRRAPGRTKEDPRE